MHRHLRYNRDLWPEVFDFGTAHSIAPLTPLSPLGDLVWVWPVWPVWPGRGCVGNPGDWRRNSLACSKNCLFLFAIFWYILIHFTLSEFRFSISTSKRFCHLLCPLVLFHSARGLNGAEILVLVSALGEACKFFANALDSSSWNAEKAIRNDWRDLERFRTVQKWLAFVETTVILPPVFVGNVDTHEPDEQQFEINCRDAKWKTYMGHTGVYYVALFLGVLVEKTICGIPFVLSVPFCNGLRRQRNRIYNI